MSPRLPVQWYFAAQAKSTCSHHGIALTVSFLLVSPHATANKKEQGEGAPEASTVNCSVVN
eukprot:scaffold145736_cov40-Tisochrysis_lutea.AAC.4